MRADKRFLKQDKSFWASVRVVSQQVGYTQRGGEGLIKIPSFDEIQRAFKDLSFNADLLGTSSHPSAYVQDLFDYYKYRADVLNEYAKPKLMDADRAKHVYEELKKKLNPSCPIPMNKQTGEKKAPAYFTGIINMLVEAHATDIVVDYDPRELTSITQDGKPLRTLSRRVDGAFPSAINPVAIWEIKEYYHTTTFGSRVADGVYETLLDGMELEELREHTGAKVDHCLMIDAYYTWWVCGKSYLCRIIDMLNMGFVDEVLFGYEVVEQLPEIVAGWAKKLKQGSYEKRG